jgi:5-methylcytosine-specific restriction endonuclease McrA
VSVPKLRPARSGAPRLVVPTTSDRLYVNPRWVNLSRSLRRQHRICQRCNEALSQHVHHVVPVEQDPTRAFDLANLLVVCEPCHRALHAPHTPQIATPRAPS